MIGCEPPSYLAFYGHHKCGTAWINRIIAEVCFRLPLNFRIVHRPADWMEYGTLEALINRESTKFLSFTNADQTSLPQREPRKSFHVIRDPRDIVVSAYFSHRYSHPTKEWPELADHRRQLQSMSKLEGLFREMEFSAHELRQIESWDYMKNNCLERKFEDIIASPKNSFREIFRFLGILDQEPRGSLQDFLKKAICSTNRLRNRGRRFMPGNVSIFPYPFISVASLPGGTFDTIVAKSSFDRMSGGRSPGEENERSHYRKGISGDWRNHFSDAHKKEFKERFGQMLIDLGYERNSEW
jgi:hypothetical protein